MLVGDNTPFILFSVCVTLLLGLSAWLDAAFRRDQSWLLQYSDCIRRSAPDRFERHSIRIQNYTRQLMVLFTGSILFPAGMLYGRIIMHGRPPLVGLYDFILLTMLFLNLSAPFALYRLYEQRMAIVKSYAHHEIAFRHGQPVVS